MLVTRSFVGLLIVLFCGALAMAAEGPFLDKAARQAAIDTLIEQHGEAQAERISRGVKQAADRWWLTDGDAESFVRFCKEHFLADEQEQARAFLRLQEVLEQVDGHLHEIRREITTPMDLDTGPLRPIDQLFAGVDLSAHVSEDLYSSKVAFLPLLNFPIHTLSERLEHGPNWQRQDWARSRMMDRLSVRVPATVSQEITRAFTAADQYIANYYIRLDRLVAPGGERPFPEGKRLITHWGLRDELKSQYAEADGLGRQRLILRVMERIVRQEIPAEVIDNPERLWAPGGNEVWQYDAKAAARGSTVRPTREADTRYEKFLDVYRAVRRSDPYFPQAPTYIDRKFELDREIPEKEVEALFVSVLTSKEFKDLGERIRERLGRPLEPFDIWYDGFKPRGAHSEKELDRIVSQRYPTVESFQKDLPRILTQLGFSPERAAWLAEHIVVDPARGAGHAMGAARRQDKAHLRTHFGKDGMDYKGYNIAIHELGHNVEQVLSLNGIDYWWLSGVPNTAFTEALAFVFQNRDLELLGLSSHGEDASHMEALDTLWATAETGGVALVDMAVWRWMYERPDASAAELRQAVLDKAREVWNRYYAPVFAVRDQEVLAIYSHMIVYGLYLPDYPLGHMIAFQVADRLRRGDFGGEFERVAKQGRLTPDAWMRGAVGQPISAKVLLAKARKALDATPARVPAESKKK